MFSESEERALREMVHFSFKGSGILPQFDAGKFCCGERYAQAVLARSQAHKLTIKITEAFIYIT